MIYSLKGVMMMPRKKTGLYDDKAYQREYHRNMKSKLLQFNPNNEEDMILYEHLKQQKNASAYIKALILADINSKKVGHWLPGCFIGYDKTVGPGGGEYMKPVYGVCKDHQTPIVAICSECGTVFNLEYADDFCPECKTKMIPWSDDV